MMSVKHKGIEPFARLCRNIVGEYKTEDAIKVAASEHDLEVEPVGIDEWAFKHKRGREYIVTPNKTKKARGVVVEGNCTRGIGNNLPEFDFIGEIDFEEITPTEFLYGYFYARGYTSLTVASPKVGKSQLALLEAIDMASGGKVSGRKFDKLKALYFNAEDDKEAIKARVASICTHYEIPISEIAGTVAIESGMDFEKFVLIRQDKTGRKPEIVEQAFKHLEKKCEARKFDVVVLDPLQDFSHADETNETFRLLGQRIRRMAQNVDVAVHIVHHARKMASGATPSLDDARGGSSLRGTSRFNRILVPMTESECTKAGVENHRSYFRIGESESTLAPPASIRNKWYEKIGVDIPNGQNVTVPVRWEWPDAFEGVSVEDAGLIYDFAGDLPEGDRRESSQSSEWFGRKVAEKLGIDVSHKAGKARVSLLLKTWLGSGVLKIEKMSKKINGREVKLYGQGSNDPRQS
ncbi:AAA family ATPase [Tateyamaria sp.]|uniref:AAA family ATPase n=1 Tax=Tateyamaria sp. TaxID=1929288 RepID=UPI00329B9704